MPRCFVERCHNYGGKRLNIILHSFPNNLDKIKTWLRCIEESGHVIMDIEELAERIFEGKTNNRFRVCSEHFTEKSYQPSGLRKTLRKDAIPTIFRDVPPQKCPWQKVKTLKSTHIDSPGSGEANRRTLTLNQPNRLDHHRCGRVNTETNIKATEYFQQNTKETRKVCNFGTKKPNFTHVILKLTLEIIRLLTGEDYIVVKKTSSHGEGWSRTQSPITEPPPDSLIRAKNNDRKILELTSKIIEQLTGEKCEYLEDNRMESQQALSSLDDMVNGLSDHTSVRIVRKSLPCEEKEEIHRDQRQPYQFSNVKLEAVSYDKRNITDLTTYSCTDNREHYPSTPIKEEPVSYDETNFPDSETHAPTDHTQQHQTSLHIKEEHLSCDRRNFKDPDIYTETDHREQHPSLIKEEPVTYEGGNLTESNSYTATDHVDHNSASMEDPSSCDEGKLASPTDYAQHHPSNHVISESALYDKVMSRNTDMYAEAQQSSTRAECENEDAQNNYSLFDKGNLDTDIYALIKHAQAKYKFTRIEDGSSSEEETSKDKDPHTPADHTQQRPPGEAVPQTFQCPDCSECFTRKSGLLNHRRNHRQEKLTCSKCGKVFSKRSSLQNHLTLHTGEKPFACPVCGKCFARKSNLISHETIHSGKASFICAECGRYFVCKVHLTKHQIIHEK